MLDTRERIAARFREAYQCGDQADSNKANVYPYFIGVFDTVAALSRPGAVVLLSIAALVVAGIASVFLSSLQAFGSVAYLHWLRYFTVDHVAEAFAAFAALALATFFLRDYVKFDFHVPGYGFFKSVATIHIAPPKHKFTEYSLNPNVMYAKHAISIDENRFDFQRVGWNPSATRGDIRDGEGNIYFEQVWFAGVHADIGGGYPENESRLSDITLNWMLSQAAIIPNGIKYDQSVLTVFPDPAGPQHDECKAGNWQRRLRDLPADWRTHISEATMHRSVYQRFEAPSVVQYDIAKEYRPDNLQNHVDFAHYYPNANGAPSAPKAVADDVEQRWRAKCAQQR